MTSLDFSWLYRQKVCLLNCSFYLQCFWCLFLNDCLLHDNSVHLDLGYASLHLFVNLQYPVLKNLQTVLSAILLSVIYVGQHLDMFQWCYIG